MSAFITKRRARSPPPFYYHNGGQVVVVKGGVAEESGGHAAARLGGESAAHLQGLAQWRKEAAWRKGLRGAEAQLAGHLGLPAAGGPPRGGVCHHSRGGLVEAAVGPDHPRPRRLQRRDGALPHRVQRACGGRVVVFRGAARPSVHHRIFLRCRI